ncbi:MAG TPA: hypothetical protein VFA81_00960 [Burkholderiales bacterium]|nr:hypothetical protein [Burkholderiales bacterium]
MKRSFRALLIFCAMLSSLAFAQTKDEHAGHHPEGTPPAEGAQAPQPGQESKAASDASPVNAGMKQLQELMARIERSTDATERESLLHEHMLAMLEEIKLVRSQTNGMKMAIMGGMQKAGMDTEGKKASAKSGKKDKPSGTMDGMMGDGMMGMHKMMEQRVGMLELLLEQAIKHAHQREAAEH